MEDIQFSSVIISNDSNKIKINSYRNNYLGFVNTPYINLGS